MSEHPLDLFHPYTADWFTRELGKPTLVQEEAWPSIARGKHTLVSAPTGTGKTLSAFLVFIDRLKAQAREGTLKQELQLIYISPLKSLASDIRENLNRPLYGITQEEEKAGIVSKGDFPGLTVSIRTGDTTQSERRAMIKKPPHILITTPESLFLLLTSRSGKSILRTAKYIILDELHALIDSKRGVHLMLSLARLDQLCHAPLQRIGLSATIEPLDRAAEYLAPEPVTVIAPKMYKEIKIEVTSSLGDKGVLLKNQAWQEIARTVLEHCEGTRSVIAFADGRMYSEKLAYYVNQIAGDGFARTHHGSLSKEQRHEVEQSLKNGELRLLVATSSMELGIDVGDVDRVFQIGCPRSISSTMQRLGRAGHNPGRTSVMHIFPRAASEGLYCGLTAEVVRNGGIELCHPPKNCFDILAQHLVSMAVDTGYILQDVMKVLSRVYSFKNVTEEEVRSVLCMLAGDYEHEEDIPVRPRILYDRIHERVEGDAYSRMLAVSAGGTIPDKGMYSAKTENGVKIGELDEEYVYEARVGDKFLLGTFAWQIAQIQKDTVIVKQTDLNGARLPFWKGDIKGRRLQTGIEFGKILRRLSCAEEEGNLLDELGKLGLDELAAKSAEDFLKRQMESAGMLPDDHTIIIEHFRDSTNVQQMMVHSIFGRQVNAPLAILATEAAKRILNTNICCVDDDDGFLLFPYHECELPENLLYQIQLDSAVNILKAILPVTPLFNINFRYNAAHALMMGVRRAGRQPLWVQRLRSAQMLDSLVKYENHPLVKETKRECLEDCWDLDGLLYVLNGIQSGNIGVREMYLEEPSPMSLPFRHQTEALMMYDYAPTSSGVKRAAEEALEQAEMIKPSPEHLAQVSERKRLPEDEKQLHSLLMIEGDVVAGELDVPIDWFEKLAGLSQADYIEPGLWIASEHKEEYQSAFTDDNLEAKMHLVRRVLRYRGAQSREQMGERYFWTDKNAEEVLSALCEQGKAVLDDGMYYHAELYNRARRETVKYRRRQIQTMPPERYADLLINRAMVSASPAEQLELSLKKLCGQTFSPALWESAILPSRVSGYRPELLDTILSQGNVIWNFSSDTGLSFQQYEESDWDADLSEVLESLEGHEKIIYEALLKRGASFMQRLEGLLEAESPYETLLKLMEKGLVRADSFVPVRQWLNREKIKKSTARQRVNARMMALKTGRWEVARPLLHRSVEQQLERNFDSMVILSRETMKDVSWATALETLRVWEYTGRVRRGYFIEGLSGIQFIREKDFAGTMIRLEQKAEKIVWVSAVDPAQPWGKYLAHMEEKSFLNVPGTFVALQAGIPIAVFERQGKVLRVFEPELLPEALHEFISGFKRKQIYHDKNRLLVKEYPPEAEEALSSSGFKHEIQDYVLYRG